MCNENLIKNIGHVDTLMTVHDLSQIEIKTTIIKVTNFRSENN